MSFSPSSPSSLPILLPLLTITILFLPHVTTTPTTHQVSVGQNGIFYVPDTITAKVGDMVVFDFYNNHSVVEGIWTTPCVPQSNGFYSGFIAAPLDSPAAPQHFVVTINDTQPHYFYCAQEGLCNAGMVGVINPPSNQPGDLAAFAVRAAETDPNASAESLAPPNAPIGGVISIESASAASASTSNDDSYSYLLTAFASGPVAAPTNATNGSYVPTGIISDTTRLSSATMSSAAGSSGSSSGVKVTSVVMVTPTPTSSPALTSSMSVISSSPAPSATTKTGAAGRVGVGDMGLTMFSIIVLVGFMLNAK